MSEEQPNKKPEKNEEIDEHFLNEAVEYLQSLRLHERPLEPAQLRQAVGRLLVNIRNAEKSALRITLYRRMAAAAVILIVLGAGLYSGHRWLSPRTLLQTTYGEIRSNRLPDGTEVMANADTRILYSTDWKDGKDREVWLKGEAFFHVSKTPLKSRFIVHTDHFDILVTGTKFNAVNRADKANITLEEGSVTLLAADQKEQKMLPGDFVEYHNGLLEKRAVQHDSVMAWKEHILVFNDTPLWQLVNIIREYYGVTVQPVDEATANKTLYGILRNDNLDVLLRALEMTGDFKVEHSKDKIIIYKGSLTH